MMPILSRRRARTISATFSTLMRSSGRLRTRASQRAISRTVCSNGSSSPATKPMVTLTAVRPDARASAMTRSESVRRLSRFSSSSLSLGSESPPSALTMIGNCFESNCAAATAGNRTLAPAMPRNRRRSKENGSFVIRHLTGTDPAEIGQVVAPPPLHGEDQGSKIGDIPQRIGGDHEEIGEPARRDETLVVRLAKGVRIDHRRRADRFGGRQTGAGDEQLELLEQGREGIVARGQAVGAGGDGDALAPRLVGQRGGDVERAMVGASAGRRRPTVGLGIDPQGGV